MLNLLSKMVPEARKKAYVIIIIAFILLACVIVFAGLYFGDVFDNDSGTRTVREKRTAPDGNSRRNATSSVRKNAKGVDHDSKKVTTTMAITTTKGPQYRVYLNGSTSSGKVFITVGDQVGFVCSDGYDDNAARVTCKELGYKQGFAYNLLNKGNYLHFTTFEPILSVINCTGSELKLSDCDGFELTNETFCSWFAAVFCYNDEPYELRLLNGTYTDSGLVEMKIAGEWRLFCGIWTVDDGVADILCRMMNYTGGTALDRGILGPTNYTKIWVPYIYCGDNTETKKSIFDCEMILHTENILVDNWEFRNNRYNFEFMSCYEFDSSYAAAVQCRRGNSST